MQSKPTYIIRVDGGHQIGLGHTVRCLNLADEMNQQGKVAVFLTRGRQMASRVHAHGYKAIALDQQADFKADLHATLKVAKEYQAVGIITDLSNSIFLKDTQAFVDYLNALKASGLKLIVIDGGSLTDCLSTKAKFAADEVFIPYFGAEKMHYQLNGSTKVFLGVDYFIFSPQIKEWAAKTRNIQVTVKNVLVSMGGSDPHRLTLKALAALQQIPGKMHITVVLGMKAKIDVQALIKSGPHPVVVVRHASHMPKLFYQADMAVISSGLTKYEAALLGTPLVCLGAPSQVFPESFETKQLAVCLKKEELDIQTIVKVIIGLANDFSLRQRFCDNGKRLLDGHGSRRVVELL